MRRTSESDCIWQRLPSEVKELIKEVFFAALIAETNYFLQSKIANLISSIAEEELSSNNNWDNLLKFLSDKLTDYSISPQTAKITLDIITRLIPFLPTTIKNNESVKQSLSTFITNESPDIKLKAHNCLTAMFKALKGKEATLYNSLMQPYFETIDIFYKTGQEDELAQSLRNLTDLIESKYSLVRKHIDVIFVYCSNVATCKIFENTLIPLISSETILTAIMQDPAVFDKNANKLSDFIQIITINGLVCDFDLNDEWYDPSYDTFYSTNCRIEEQEIKEVTEQLRRLTTVVKKGVVLPLIVKLVSRLLGEGNWVEKYVGILIYSQICDKLKWTEAVQFIEFILSCHTNENAKVRFSVALVIFELTNFHNTNLLKHYSDQIYYVSWQLLNDHIAKVSLMAVNALSAIADSSNTRNIQNYLHKSLDALFTIYLNPLTSLLIKEESLTAIINFIHSAGSAIEPFADKCLEIFIEAFGMSLHKNNKLAGHLLESISMVGVYRQHTFLDILPKLVESMIMLQDELVTAEEELHSYIASGWNKVIPLCVTYKVYLVPSIIESCLKLIQRIPSSDQLEAENIKFTMEDVTLVKNDVNTYKTGEIAESIRVIQSISYSLGPLFLDYFEPTDKLLFPLCLYRSNSQIRSACGSLIASLAKSLCFSASFELQQISKRYVGQLFSALELEYETYQIEEQAENIKELLNHSGCFLNQEEVDFISDKVFSLFDRIEREKEGLLVSEEEEIDYDDVEDSEKLLTTLYDLLGVLFKNHKLYSKNLLEYVLINKFPVFFSDTAEEFKLKIGIYVLADLIDFLKEDYLKGSFLEMFVILEKYIKHPDSVIRRGVNYALGLFARESNELFDTIAEKLLDYILFGIDYVPSEGDDLETDAFGECRDNAVSALGKFIKYKGETLNGEHLKVLVDKWLACMPIRFDALEAEESNGLLLELVRKRLDLISGDNDGNLKRVVEKLLDIYANIITSQEQNREVEDVFANLFSSSRKEAIEGICQQLNGKHKTKLKLIMK